VPTVCWCELVVSILIIFVDLGSCLSRNVCLIIQIWSGLLVLKAACIRALYTSIGKIMSKSSKPAFLKLWSADHKWSSGSALVVLLD
jgi:hypothetical protein